jgi:hypothetical protein
MRAFERPWLVDRTFRAARKSPRVCDELVDILSGEATRISWRFRLAVALGR